MKLTWGYPVKEWRQAKREVRAVLIDRAKAIDIISYVELAAHVTAIQLEPQSFACAPGCGSLRLKRMLPGGVC